MTKEQIGELVEKYWDKEGYVFPQNFENRFDPISSAILYSLIRYFGPVNCLEIGSWLGGSTCLIMAALQKSGKPFNFVCSEFDDYRRSETEMNVLNKCGDVPMMVGDITKNLDKVPDKLDFVFVDTDHDRETTEWIISNIYPRCKEGSLIAMHDWAVQDINGEWVGKADTSKKEENLPETEYLIELHQRRELPLDKLYWAYEGIPGQTETAFWTYKNERS